jgi:hypothetical protein
MLKNSLRLHSIFKAYTFKLLLCYSLDLHCPANVHMLKVWTPARDAVWDVVRLGHWRYALEGDIGTLGLLLLPLSHH